MEKDKNKKIIKVEYCPRCRGDHRDTVFHRFKGNFISADGEDWQYWGWCPTHLEPILLRVSEYEEISDNRTSEAETKEGKNCTLCGCSSECKDSKSCPDETEQLFTN